MTMPADGKPLPPDALAKALELFADAILPGDDLFPAASSVGAQGLLASRLRERFGPEGPATLAATLIERGGLADAEAAAKRLEVEKPTLFGAAQQVLVYAYYEAPAVIAAIRTLGHIYNETPQPEGYRLRSFDPGRDTPAKPRGHYVATHDVRRVDLSDIESFEP
jgi:hypothetical protein